MLAARSTHRMWHSQKVIEADDGASSRTTASDGFIEALHGGGKVDQALAGLRDRLQQPDEHVWVQMALRKGMMAIVDDLDIQALQDNM